MSAETKDARKIKESRSTRQEKIIKRKNAEYENIPPHHLSDAAQTNAGNQRSVLVMLSGFVSPEYSAA